jgi:hypothetical protein
VWRKSHFNGTRFELLGLSRTEMPSNKQQNRLHHLRLSRRVEKPKMSPPQRSWTPETSPMGNTDIMNA